MSIAALVAPEIFTTKKMYVEIETQGKYIKGTTLGDFHGTSGKDNNAEVILDLNLEKFVDLLVKAAKYYREVEA